MSLQEKLNEYGLKKSSLEHGIHEAKEKLKALKKPEEILACKLWMNNLKGELERVTTFLERLKGNKR